MLSFLIASILLVMIAVAAVVFPLLSNRDGAAAPVAGTLSAILIPVAVLLIYATISSYPWQSTVSVADPMPAQPTGQASEQAQSMATAVRGLEQRLGETPDDIDGWLLLGRSYTNQQRYTDADNVYRKVLELTDGSSIEAMLGLAETMVLSDQSPYSEQAGVLIESVLSADPDNRKALWYGGQIALSRDNIASARKRWSRLLTLSPPDGLRRILEIQLEALDTPAVSIPPVAVTGITVQVSIEATLREKVNEGARLFIIVRDADAPGPPLAAVPRLARDLPMTVTITDADRMIPGRSLGDVARIKVIARVANGGDPLAAPGDIFGEVLWQRSGDQQGPLEIILNKIVP